jgi:Holliday junction resolvase-like predicted endonuclease
MTKEYSAIGTYWERGNKNEIDIVAVNEKEKTILFAEIKRDPKRIDLELLKKKSEKLLQKFKGYTPSYRGFSLKDL